MIRQSFKFTQVVALIFRFMGHSLLVGLTTHDLWARRRKRTLLMQLYSRKALRALAIDISELGDVKTQGHNALYVGNHLSYVDILLIASRLPTCFVTSVEVRETPILGWLTELGGCLYVERRSRAFLGSEINELSEALIKGLNVTIFPEATSTDGTEVLRFRRPLFQAAVNSLRSVKPFCLNYLTISERKIDLTNRNIICWYGDMPFVSHLWCLAGESSVRVRIHWLSDCASFENGELVTSTLLAELTHSLVKENFVTLAPSNYSEKETGQEVLPWPVQEGGLVT